MGAQRVAHCGWRTFLIGLAAASVWSAQPVAAQGQQENLLPGAKLLHKFKDEVFRIPLILETAQGPRVLVWFDAFDPAPIPKFPSDPMPKPQFDLVFWDPKTNQEVHKMSYPKDEQTPPSPVAAGTLSRFMHGNFGTIALSPDAKRLATVSMVYVQKPGVAVHQATSYIKVCDLATSKWQNAHSYDGRDGPHILFAPDGNLVVLRQTSWAIREIGKEKAISQFKLVRSPNYVPVPNGFSVYGIRNAVLTPDGKYLAVAADGLVTVYDTKTGEVVLQADRAAADPKGTTNGQNTDLVELVFAPAAHGPTLLSVETINGAPKSFVLARVFDVKAKKETSRKVLAEQPTKASPFGGAELPNWGRPAAYFNTKGEPRVIFNGKLLDGASGKALHQFHAGYGELVSQNGQYLVHLTTTSNPKKLGVEIWSLDNTQ